MINTGNALELFAKECKKLHGNNFKFEEGDMFAVKLNNCIMFITLDSEKKVTISVTPDVIEINEHLDIYEEDEKVKSDEINQLKQDYEDEKKCSNQTALNWAESSKAFKAENDRLKTENQKLKRLLKLANEDMTDYPCNVCVNTDSKQCDVCVKGSFFSRSIRWRHANEVDEVLKNERS